MNISMTPKKLDLIHSKINFTNEMLAMPINIMSIVKYITEITIKNCDSEIEIVGDNYYYEHMLYLRDATKYYNSLEHIMNDVRLNLSYSVAVFNHHEMIILLKLFSFGEENEYMRKLRFLIENLNLRYNEHIEDKNGKCIMCSKSCTTLLYEKLDNEKEIELKKIEMITELIKNKLITLDEFKNMLGF